MAAGVQGPAPPGSHLCPGSLLLSCPQELVLTDTLGCRVLAFGAFGVALATHEVIRKPISQGSAEPGCPSDLGAAGGSTHEYRCSLAPVRYGFGTPFPFHPEHVLHTAPSCVSWCCSGSPPAPSLLAAWRPCHKRSSWEAAGRGPLPPRGPGGGAHWMLCGLTGRQA